MFKYRAMEFNEVLSTTGKRAWCGLVALVQLLPTLKRFIFACTFQLPTCLLVVLEQDKPDCDLYLETLSLRSLLQDPGVPPQVEPYELRLATSSSLRDINVSTHEMHPDGILDYNLVGIKDLLNGLALNPRELNIDEECAKGIAKTTDVLPCEAVLRQEIELDSVEVTRSA